MLTKTCLNKAVWITLFLLGAFPVQAQHRLAWSKLEACETPSGQITFTDEVESLDQERVLIKGFMIPLDTDGKEYALSAYPMSECFFCGNAGPTSMMELVLADPRRYQLDDYVTFEGVFTLIPGSQGLVFRLEEAKED